MYCSSAVQSPDEISFSKQARHANLGHELAQFQEVGQLVDVALREHDGDWSDDDHKYRADYAKGQGHEEEHQQPEGRVEGEVYVRVVNYVLVSSRGPQAGAHYKGKVEKVTYLCRVLHVNSAISVICLSTVLDGAAIFHCANATRRRAHKKTNNHSFREPQDLDCSLKPTITI